MKRGGFTANIFEISQMPKQVIHCPVSLDHIAVSCLELIEVTYFWKLTTAQVQVSIGSQAQVRLAYCNQELCFQAWLNLHITLFILMKCIVVCLTMQYLFLSDIPPVLYRSSQRTTPRREQKQNDVVNRNPWEQPRSQGPLSSYLEKVPWLRLVTCLLDSRFFADSRDVIEGRGWKVKVCLSTLAY